MISGQPTRDRMRVLLVSDDDAYSAALKPCLTGLHILSLTESSVWMAKRAGLDVTRGIDAVLLDRQTSGRLQLGLYETLRPSDGVARVPVIFTRSRLTAASGGFDHKLDFYQSEEASPEETARLVKHVLGVLPEHPRLVPVRPVPARRMAAPAATAVASRAQRAAAVLAPGLMQRLVLWGIATVLIGFTFWPLLGSGPMREIMYGPLQALSGGPSQLADVAKVRLAR